MDLSIIIPFVGEYPQVLFTIQSVAQSLRETGIDFEIIAVNNYCEDVRQQALNQIASAKKEIVLAMAEASSLGKKDLLSDKAMINVHKGIMPIYEDRSGVAIKAAEKRNPWLKYVEYKDRLSHWQAKRVGVEVSSGSVLLFLDAHVVPSKSAVPMMYDAYIFEINKRNQNYHNIGTLHLPLTYKILESKRLIYKMVIENNFYGYSFTGFRENEDLYEVPCMSTCGMMISRKIYDNLGGWPSGMGIYGGGENFMNYALAVCGYKKYIFPDATLFHHGDKRDYHYIYDDMVKNRFIAHYLFGGEQLLRRLQYNTKGNPLVLSNLASEAIKESKEQRQQIKEVQKYTIEEWAASWGFDEK